MIFHWNATTSAATTKKPTAPRQWAAAHLPKESKGPKRPQCHLGAPGLRGWVPLDSPWSIHHSQLLPRHFEAPHPALPSDLEPSWRWAVVPEKMWTQGTLQKGYNDGASSPWFLVMEICIYIYIYICKNIYVYIIIYWFIITSSPLHLPLWYLVFLQKKNVRFTSIFLIKRAPFLQRCCQWYCWWFVRNLAITSWGW